MNEDQVRILIKDLQALGKECEWVEFKVNNSSSQEIGEYISAISNSACYHRQKEGYLVYGIEDGTFKAVGTKFRPKSDKIKGQELENWLATQLNPPIDFEIVESIIDDKLFSIFIIDATRVTPVSFKETSYIRVGSYKKKLSDHPEKERKIWERTNHVLFENDSAYENVSADDVLKLIDYTSYFELCKFPLPATKKGIVGRLIQDKIITQNESRYDISNLGALLFAKEIEAFETLARKAVRVIVYDGDSRIKAIREQVGKKGYAVGFEGLIKYINDQLPTQEVIGQAFRTNVYVYPIIAVRELVANAIIHQDLSVKGVSPMIEIFKNRVEITNPGKPLIDILRFVDHSPESRNEVLARKMRLLNICEERGSGIDKVVFECEINKLPAPEFTVGDNYTRAILHSPKALRQMDKQEKVRACYYHACLKFVSGEMMTNQSLRQRLEISDANAAIASRVIKDTLEAELIKIEDEKSTSKKYVKYIPFWA